MASKGEAASPAGSSAILAALASSAFAAGVTLFVSELLRVSSQELRERVFTPRVTRRLEQKRGEEVDMLHPDAVPRCPGRAPLAWLVPVFRVQDDAMLPEVGLDAVFFVKFTRLGLHVVALSALFDLSAVLWANLAGEQDIAAASDLDKFTMANLEPKSTLLLVHLASVILKTIAVFVLMYRLSLWVAAAQDRVAADRLSRPEGRTVFLSDVPGGASAAGDAMAALHPGGFVASVAAIDPRPSDALAKERDTLLSNLEDARWAMEHSSVISSDGGITPARRPTHRTGLLGLTGPRVDSLETYGAALLAVDSRLAAAREAALRGEATADAPPRGAAFVTFATPRAAAIAAQVTLSRDPLTWRLMPAPPPDDVLWQNAGRMPPLLRQAATYATTAALYAMVVFYMIPIAAVSALSTLSQLEKLLPFIKPLVEPPVLRALLEGILPGLALMIFLAFLPALVRALAKARGVRTLSELDAAELRGMFLFAVINVFLGNLLAGSVFSGLKSFVDHPAGIFSLLGTTVPQTSRFFISFIALKALGGAASDVGCVVASAVYVLKTRVLGARRTARREAAAWAPHSSSLGSEASDVLLVLLLSIVFSTVAPLLLCFSALYFVCRLGAVKAAVLYRHEASYDGAAALWAPARGRVVASLLVYQATLAGVFALKRSPVPAAICIGALMPLTAAAARAMAERFDAAVPGRSPPPLGWFARDAGPAPAMPQRPKPQHPRFSDARPRISEIRAVPEDAEARRDPSAAAYLPPGLRPLPENELAELRAAAKAKAVAAGEEAPPLPLQHMRNAGMLREASASEDEGPDEWRDPREEH